QALVAAVGLRTGHSFRGTAFLEATGTGLLPIISDQFDLFKDIVFAGFCFQSHSLLVQFLAPCSLAYSLLIHVYFICDDSVLAELSQCYIPLLLLRSSPPSIDVEVAEDGNTVACSVWPIFYRQTTPTKRWVLLLENLPQCVLAAVFLKLQGVSLLVAILNLLCPVLQLSLAFLLFHPLRRASGPFLGHRVARALQDHDCHYAQRLWEEAEAEKDLDLFKAMLPEIRQLRQAFQLQVGEPLSEDSLLLIREWWPVLVEQTTEVSLYGHDLQADGAKVLSKALEVNRSLQKLSLVGNALSDFGVQVLASAAKSSVLEELYVAALKNKEKSKALAQFMAGKSRQNDLDLKECLSNPIAKVEARSFVKLMEQVNQMGLGQLRPLGMMKAPLRPTGRLVVECAMRNGDGCPDFMTSVGQLDLIHLVWEAQKPDNSAGEDDVPEQATEDASGALENVRSEASDVAIPGPSTPEEAQEVLEALEALRVVAQKESVRGIQRLVKDFQKVDRLERLERGIELLDKARLLPRLGGTSSAPKSDFEPWSHLVSIVNAFGGPEDFNKRVEAVNLQHFDECLDVLNAAGLTRKPGQEAMNSRDFSSAVSAWKEVVGILVTAGGPALFLESLKGIAVEDFLRMVGLLRQAGLARPLDDEDGVEMTRRPSFSYGYGESAGRIRNEMLQDFVQRVIQAGGFHAFWHALKGVDLMKLKGDLHCLAVIRRKLQELIAEDWWLAVHDAEGLEELLHSALAERKRRADDLTLKQRQQLVKRFREVGGVEAFLDGFANINLSQMLQQHKALHKARIRDVGVIEALSKIGELVKNKVEHLHGLQAVAATLVRWGDRHYRGEEPVRLWKAMHQQVTWLLMAIEENGALLKATVNHGNHPGKEPELTPARLAQFLQALRPVGGVPGFLAAFRGLDFPMAAAQARILHDACVRSKETTKRLAVIFGLLRFNLTQLRGLEHFLRNFVAPVFAEAGPWWERVEVSEGGVIASE
ncbi:unnamed protein product, partial [Durusdinium trenchii]